MNLAKPGTNEKRMPIKGKLYREKLSLLHISISLLHIRFLDLGRGFQFPAMSECRMDPPKRNVDNLTRLWSSTIHKME